MSVASIIAAALAVLAHVHSALAADSGNAERPRPGVIVLADDDGGGIDDHVKFFNRIRQAGVPVRIDGLCISACTLALALPPGQVCIAPSASLGFHAASTYGRVNLDLTAALVRRYYPKAVQDWLAAWSERNGPLTGRVIYMSADEAVRLGVLPACGD